MCRDLLVELPAETFVQTHGRLPRADARSPKGASADEVVYSRAGPSVTWDSHAHIVLTIHRPCARPPALDRPRAEACSNTETTNPTTSSTGSGGAGGTGGTGGGTGGTGGGPLLDKPCDPLVPSFCGFPFPSNVYLADDAKSPSGHRVALPKAALPTIVGSGHVDPTPWNQLDGFSSGMAPMTDMPGATITGLPTQNDIELSITAQSPTILLDAESGELVPHFAELDMSASSGKDDRALMIRPVVRLKDKTRYIVAIRHVVDDKSQALAPSPAFQALRDGTPSTEPSVGARRALYADIFGKLEKAGVAKSDLQIAWDYTTASRDNNTRWLVHMRDDALATLGTDGPAYAIDDVEMDPNPYIHMRIHGHMTVPLYLDKAGPGGRLVFGADGLPKQNGTADYPFLVHVPNSAMTSDEPFAVIQNGHGLLGDKTEGENGYLAQICDKNHFIGIAVDLAGMAEEDYDSVLAAIGGDIGGFEQLVERQHQGILNSLLAMRMMKNTFWKDPQLQVNGHSVIDPTHLYYRGDSQGGIFGTTYMALSTDVTRGLLGEPGMPYNLLLNRSADFEPFFGALQLVYSGGRSIQQVLGLVQMLWDRTEPNGYAPYIAANMLPGTPQHEILIHAAIGDHQVTPLGAHIIARAVKAQNLKPVNRSIFGLPEADGPFMGSGIVEFSFGLPTSPETNTPPEGATYPEDDDPHDKVRVLDAARNQTEQFLRTGVIDKYCDGPCDPE
ncbi:Hypothetical protein A7982_00422 [Minicystis rosea]|nr:Hypothetical protein A7982_00422 [Minicystis rosea]